MAFKMKGFPKLSGIGGVQAEKNLQKELKSMATGKSKTKEPTMSYEEFAKKNPGTARYLTKEQYEAKIKKLKSGFKMKGFSPFDDNHDQRPEGAEGDNQKNVMGTGRWAGIDLKTFDKRVNDERKSLGDDQAEIERFNKRHAKLRKQFLATAKPM
tara:strand:- start:167 stop:631 length:465 start_codon:yes stop_codon:yes gene_type:complete